MFNSMEAILRSGYILLTNWYRFLCLASVGRNEKVCKVWIKIGCVWKWWLAKENSSKKVTLESTLVKDHPSVGLSIMKKRTIWNTLCFTTLQVILESLVRTKSSKTYPWQNVWQYGSVEKRLVQWALHSISGIGKKHL